MVTGGDGGRVASLPVIKDDDHARLERIEVLLEKLQKELSDVREEKRVTAEQIMNNVALVERRVRKRASSARAAHRRATDRERRTSGRLQRQPR
jgi:hypothetical protein